MKIIFTQHSLERMKLRKIEKLEVFDTIKFPDRIIKKDKNYIFCKKQQRGFLEVVATKEKFIKFITVYYN